MNVSEALVQFQTSVTDLHPELSSERIIALTYMQYNREKYGLVYDPTITRLLDQINQSLRSK